MKRKGLCKKSAKTNNSILFSSHSYNLLAHERNCILEMFVKESQHIFLLKYKMVSELDTTPPPSQAVRVDLTIPQFSKIRTFYMAWWGYTWKNHPVERNRREYLYSVLLLTENGLNFSIPCLEEQSTWMNLVAKREESFDPWQTTWKLKLKK
jgi:hypothetical protein